MKNPENIGALIILTLVFWLIFTLTELFLEKVGYTLHLLVYALIASWAWVYWPRGEK